MEDKIKCPKCSSTQLHADKRGFSTGKAVIGTVAGGVLAGAAMGGAGSNKIQITCLNCGHVFSPGGGSKQVPQQSAQMSESQKTANVIFFIVATIVSLSVLFTKGILWMLLVLVIAMVVYGIMSAALKKNV